MSAVSIPIPSIAESAETVHERARVEAGPGHGELRSLHVHRDAATSGHLSLGCYTGGSPGRIASSADFLALPKYGTPSLSMKGA
jgi:hypothetical protein